MIVSAVGGEELLAFLILAGIFGTIFGSAVICGLKGKYGMVAGGLVVHPLWLVGAIRLAKPDSWWARRHYDGHKLMEAQARAAAGGFLHPASAAASHHPAP